MAERKWQQKIFCNPCECCAHDKHKTQENVVVLFLVIHPDQGRIQEFVCVCVLGGGVRVLAEGGL